MEILIKQIPDTSDIVTTTVLNTKTSELENKIPDTISLVTTTVLNTKIGEVEKNFFDHAKYINTQEFNKLNAESFAARLKQPNFFNKTDFDNKLISFNKKVTSNKTNYLEVQEKLNSLSTKYDSSFLGRIYFTSNDGSQNTFVYQPTLDTLELKKDKGTLMFLVGNQRGHQILVLN